MRRVILVYAHWTPLAEPTLVGELSATQVRGKEHFSFAYDSTWLQSNHAQQIDPELNLYQGSQHSEEGNFRIFLDSCPDRWGRLLMRRREALIANKEGRKPTRLMESDYLLGVHDLYRMGALRYKLTADGPFLDNNEKLAAPPMSSLAELAFAASQCEHPIDLDDAEHLKWLQILTSPGSSLGGARPKSSVVDKDDSLWIAKFPSRFDEYDKGAWEYLVHHLALKAGISMSPCQILRLNSEQHTFLTKRFDRLASRRRHFSSAMTQLAYDDGEEGGSYLDIARFLIERGTKTNSDLKQLWRRIVFNIAVSNCDDHLRNHGFLFDDKGWCLSPAYDLNIDPSGHGLNLNIDEVDNRLDFELAFSVIDYFQLARGEASGIYDEVLAAVSTWREEAGELGLQPGEQQRLAHAFHC